MFSTALLVFLVLLLIKEFTLCIATSNFTDLHSLLAFKAAIEFDPGNSLSNNWTLNTHFCNWYGVSCKKSPQRVTALNLPSMGLVGPISPHIGNLSFLTFLDLESNGFHGQVINELGRLSNLEVLMLRYNYLTGKIPMSLPSCQKLQTLDLSFNQLIGMLPINLTTLPSLQFLYLGRNNLTGTIPISLGNMSTLQLLGLEDNKFQGTILNKVSLLPRLTNLTLGRNSFTGIIPPSLFNMSSLEKLALESNFFTGDLPKDTNIQLPNLIRLFLGGNKLTGNIPFYWYNMSRLTLLTIENNNFTGPFPEMFPLSLEKLAAVDCCNVQGEIPEGIGTLKNLTYLNLGGNRFNGTIPPAIKGMKSLQQFSLYHNELEGPIPQEICSLSQLGDLFLNENRLFGSIPECIQNLSGLQRLSLSSNELSSKVPQSFWSFDQLWYLNLSLNSLQGGIDLNLTGMKFLSIIDLSMNQLSGNVPYFAGSFQSLTFLDLSWNSFSGPIPQSFGKLMSLVGVNISNNNLSGQIPKSMEALTYLKYLNLSYNNLSGEIPTGGPFVKFTPQSFKENPELCGESISKPCPSQRSKKSRNKLFPLSYILPIIVIVIVLIDGALFYIFRKPSGNNLHQNPENPLQEQRMISYHELSHATNGFSDANLLGSGGFAKVYKGILSDGETVAVKLLNLTVDGSIKSFDAECKVLRNVRHRNLVKVISTCTNPELRALVLEYIPNGSLDKWLYSHNYCLSFLQRVSIMLDVAVALDYLHSGQLEQVIHCDLKPSNVLIDEDMVAHVSDFGITKILAANKSETQTSTLGTFGYIAPEYATEGRVSTKGDMYSYGIMLLETFTIKKPTDEIFSEELNLRKWVSSSISNRIEEVFDENLFNENSHGRSAISLQDIILVVLNLGLGCSRDSPKERFEMKDVVSKLNKIKLQILSE